MKGRPEDVTVDDLFPIYKNKPAFTKPTSDGAWWLPLLEKAYAKVNINYEMISSGSQAEAAKFLTGAPAKQMATNLQTIDELWDSLSQNLRTGFILTTACFVEYQGLQPGQGYIVKDFVKVHNSDGTILRMIKMKNPWKKGDNSKGYTGKYSKSDKKT